MIGPEYDCKGTSKIKEPTSNISNCSFAAKPFKLQNCFPYALPYPSHVANGATVTSGAFVTTPPLYTNPLSRRKKRKDTSSSLCSPLGANGATVTLGAFGTNPRYCNNEGRGVRPSPSPSAVPLVCLALFFAPPCHLEPKSQPRPCHPLFPLPNRPKAPRLPVSAFVTLSYYPSRDKRRIMSPPLTPAEMKNFSKIRFQQYNFKTLFALQLFSKYLCQIEMGIHG